HESHPTMKFEVFERLNSGSISLTAQELRNSMYRGPFTRMLRELVLDRLFRKLIGTKEPRLRMVDEELLLRFFAFRRRFPEYRPPLKRFLNEFLEDSDNASDESLEECRAVFHSTMQKIDWLLGASAFRLSNEQGVPTERVINRALF